MDKKSRELVMGKLYLKNKDYKMAEKSLHDYLSANPEDFQALKLLAQVYEHLRNFSKAFDLYERCYLVEPDRKGVLLDICRLLLMNDTSLDHVDQKKWLKLAIQTFPSNPIVVNLRESLPLSNQEPSPNKTPLDSEILAALGRVEKSLESINRVEKFLENIGSFEQRLESIEGKLEKLSIKHVQEKAIPFTPAPVTPAVTTPARPADPRTVTLPPTQVVTPKPAPQEKAAPTVPVVAAPSFPSFSAGVFSKPASTIAPTSSPHKPPATTSSFFTSNFSSLSFSPSTPKPVSEPEKKESPQAPSVMPFNFNSSLSFSSNLFGDPKQASSSTFEFLGKPNNDSGQSLQREEKPNSNLEQGQQVEEEDCDVVKTEELPIENTCDMKPIEIKSGEEDEDVVFEHRSKLFRFRDNEYKERGLGNLKVMKHKTTGKGRLIMRRDLVNLVCLNCWSCSNIERVRDTQVRFAGLDASDGDPEMTIFLAKFKTEEMTETFMNCLLKLFTDE